MLQLISITQDCVLFHDSVYNNIQYGDLSKTREDVYTAAKMAEIHNTISTRFPNGYDTQVGERGLKLSGSLAGMVIKSTLIYKVTSI